MTQRRSLYLLTAALSVLILAGWAPSARAADLIRVENPVWGFDGNVVPHAFNPLSFEIYNDSLEPVEFDLVLRQSNGIAPVDAPIVERISLAPESGRRVQMFPYIINGFSDWTLTWGRGEYQQYRLTAERQLTIGAPATVLLTDPLAVNSRGGGGVKRFDEEFFPVSVSGTTGLAGVVLDHDPRSWHVSTVRAQAFRDWLYAGGTVHILQSSDGVWPEFEAPLDELNTAAEETRVGAGLVIRHPVTIARLDGPYAEREILSRQTVRWKSESATASPQQFYVTWDTSELMFSRMKRMTQADHNWPMIYVMALVYLLVIFPGCWLIGRRRADYRVTYGVMLGAVVMFSMGFKWVGQRGYGEATALHTTTIARPLADGRLLLQQWTNLFVTDGDEYRIAHAGDGLLYSSGQTNEVVNGFIVNPPGGSFNKVDVPPFSSRTVASSAVLGGHPLNVTATVFDTTDSRLNALEVRCDPGLVDTLHEASVLYRGNVYTMAKQGDNELKLRGGGLSLSNYLRPDSWNDGNFGMGFYAWEDDPDPEELFQTAMRPLIARNLFIHDEESLKTIEFANDRARLFVYADMPEDLSPQCEYYDGDALQALIAGRVLYVIDLFPPEDGPQDASPAP